MSNQADPSHEAQPVPQQYPIDSPPVQSPREAQRYAQDQAYAQQQPYAQHQPYTQQHQAYVPAPPYAQAQPYAQDPETGSEPLSEYAPHQAPPTTLAYTNTFALVSIITAFLSPIAAVVFGHIALGQIKRTGDAGRGLALTGLIIGYSYFAFIALFVIFYLSVIGLMFASMGALMSGSGDLGGF